MFKFITCSWTLAQAWVLSRSETSWQCPHFWEGWGLRPDPELCGGLICPVPTPGPLESSCPVSRPSFSQQPLWWSLKRPPGLRHGTHPAGLLPHSWEDIWGGMRPRHPGSFLISGKHR